MSFARSEISGAVDELGRRLEALKTAYEQYFLGLDKREPTELRDAVQLLIRRIDRRLITNTALRYRLQSLLQRYNTYRNYWNRTLRAIEDGTYHRDVARVRRRMARSGVDMGPMKDLKTRGQIERAMADAAEQTRAKKDAPVTESTPAAPDSVAAPAEPVPDSAGAPSAPAGPPSLPPPPPPDAFAPAPPVATRPIARVSQPAPPKPRARPAAGPSDANLRALFQRYVKAKEMCNEDTQGLRYEALVDTVKKQLPKLQQKHGGREVEFQVVIRGGRAVLKAGPK